MGYWNFYFIAKLALYYSNFIGFHPWPNLGFALALILRPRRRPWRVLRHLVAVPLGAALLYYDSWLPPLSRVVTQVPNLESFSAVYLVELLGRFLNAQVVAGLVGLCVLIALLGRRLRISSFLLLGILFTFWPDFWRGEAPAVTAANPQNCADTVAAAPTEGKGQVEADPFSDAALTGSLDKFYAQEAKREVRFVRPDGQPIPFDLIFLHICSLAQDDMEFAKVESPLFKRFDFVFTHFNSAASYSGPAAIRLLRGSCGQPRHKDLYSPTPGRCHLFDALAGAGFTPEALLNHDGHFGGFLDDLRNQGGLTVAPLGDLGTSVHMRSFDNAPIYQDYELLSRWLQRRAAQPSQPVALYYNTISLHDGNRVPALPSRSSSETFPLRLKNLLADLDRFMSDLEKSGRKSVVVFIPEHGAAVRGDKMQISGLREIPSPAVTLVPVGIKLLGLPTGNGVRSQAVISQPTSYLGVSTLLAKIIEENPYAQGEFQPAAYVSSIPGTEFVSENEQTVVMQKKQRYFLRTPDSAWMQYSD